VRDDSFSPLYHNGCLRKSGEHEIFLQVACINGAILCYTKKVIDKIQEQNGN